MNETGLAANSGDPPELLVPAALRGEAEAIARLFRLEHPAVWRLCLGVLADRTEADDAAQDAMLKILDQLDRYDASRPWATWRNTVAVNVCRDRLRRSAARRGAEESAADQARPRSIDPASDPETVASQRELGELVTAHLGRLSPREREVFVLHDLEGGATADVASALDLAESTVRVLLMTARRRLRELLAPRLAGTPTPRRSP